MQNNRLASTAALLLITVLLTIILIYTRSVLVPFVLSLFSYSLLSVSVSWLNRHWNWPKPLSIALMLTGATLACVLLVFVVSSSIQTFIKSFYLYSEQLFSALTGLEELGAKFGYDLGIQSIEKEFSRLPIFNYIKHLTGGALSVLGNSALVIIFSIFLIAGELKATEKLPSKNLLIETMNKNISKYIITKTGISLLTGALTGMILLTGKIQLALMFATLTLFLNFIPNIGSIIATALPIPIVLLQYGIGWQFFLIIGLCGGVQIIVGNILEPKIMGESMDLHPVVILLFLMFWGLVWGIPGMFMAVPITSVLKIILSRFESTHVFSELLAGRLPQ